MMFVAAALVFFAVSAVQAGSQQELRVIRTEVQCGDGQRCPVNDATLISGEINNIVYGQKTPALSSDFKVVYNQNGLVDISSNAHSTTQNPVGHSAVLVGSGGPGCEYIGTSPNAAINGISFDQCGFTQTIDGNKVHRTIVVRVRHRFETGAVDSSSRPVWFVGYRDITVDFWLEPVNPVEEVINPPVPGVEEELDVCVELTHALVVKDSGMPYYWHIKVTADNYGPAVLGLGFKLQRCWVVPYLADNTSSRLEVNFLQNSVLDDGLLFAPPAIPQHVTNPGVSYEFSFAQLTSPTLTDSMLAADKKHQVHCSVCLCKIGGQGDDACPQITTGSVTGRAGFQNKPYRLLQQESRLAPGYARQI